MNVCRRQVVLKFILSLPPRLPFSKRSLPSLVPSLLFPFLFFLRLSFLPTNHMFFILNPLTRSRPSPPAPGAPQGQTPCGWPHITFQRGAQIPIQFLNPNSSPLMFQWEEQRRQSF